MSNRYQLVVFDWEGTISDTLGLILHTVTTVAEDLGFGGVDPYRARKFVDLGLVLALRKLFPHLSLHQHEQLLQAVQQSLVSRPTEVCLIPGSRELIQQLDKAHIHMAIATNKGQHSLQRVLQATGLDVYFKVTRSAGQVPAKPYPQMLEEIMDEFGQKPETTLMVGDSPSDMEMAKQCNVTAVGVDFYHQSEQVLKDSGASVVFDDYQLLAQFLGLPNI